MPGASRWSRASCMCLITTSGPSPRCSTTRPRPSWSSRSRAKAGSTYPRPDYLSSLRQLCDRRGVLLILDEVQTGMGRTGRWFAYQHQGAIPDILTCAKAAGRRAGGGGDDRHVRRSPRSLKPGMHASTFGGNPIACRAAMAADRDDRGRWSARAGDRDRRAIPGPIRGDSCREPRPRPRDPHRRDDDRPRPDRRCHRIRRRVHETAAADQCNSWACDPITPRFDDRR